MIPARAAHVELLLETLGRAAFGDPDARVDTSRLEAGGDGWAVATALNLLLEELDAQQRRAVESAAQAAQTEASVDLLAHLSHDMMGPLSVIVGGVETLDLVDGEQRELVGRRITAAARRLERDVRLLLDAARADAGLGAIVRLEPVDVSRVVQRVVAMRAEDAPVRVTAGPGRLVALADEDRVEDVLSVLLDNAIKHGDGLRGGIEVAIACDDEVTIDIADEGRGMGGDEQRRVFGRFERGDTPADGNGVGLYSARRLAEAMGGSLEVASAPDRGATFTLRLRVTDGPDVDRHHR